MRNKIFLTILIIFIFISPIFVFAADVYSFKLSNTAYCFNSKAECITDVKSKNIPESACVIMNDVDIGIYCPTFSKPATSTSTIVATTDKPFYFSDGSGIVIGETYANLTTCVTAYNTYKKAHPNATVKPCINAKPIGQTVVQLNSMLPKVVAGSAVSNVYKFLAPLGTMTEINTTDIGKYFNWIFNLAIGLCAALAVVMIIVGGVQYMGEESVFSKTDAKDRITKAIYGLLIAIGSWVLLNTINPALTGQGGVSVAGVTIDVEDIPWDIYQVGDNKIGCPSGYVDVVISGTTPDKINVCSSIKPDLVDMINAASAKGIRLSGHGSRTIAYQQSLRVANKCPLITTPPNKCTPNQVAIPGKSNHEKGLAVDFNCNGTAIARTDTNNVCYKWLVSNAGTYHFKNDYSKIKETWHWSTTGT